MESKIRKILAQIRPLIRQDGGDVHFVGFDASTGRVSVRLRGACAHCPMARVTLKNGIEALLKKEVPGVKEVVNAE